MSSKKAGIKRRRQHSAELKARAALEAIQERRTINEIAAEYGVHPPQVAAWKRQAVESLSVLFEGGVRVDGNALKRQEGRVGNVEGDVDANARDSAFVVQSVKWILAELIRVLHSPPLDQAQKEVDDLSEITIPLVWTEGCVKRGDLS